MKKCTSHVAGALFLFPSLRGRERVGLLLEVKADVGEEGAGVGRVERIL